MSRTPPLNVPIDVDLGQFSFQRCAQSFAQPEQFGRFLRHFFPSNLRSFSEAGNSGNVESAGPHAPLMATTVDDRRQQHARVAAAHVESANTFWPVKLMGG